MVAWCSDVQSRWNACSAGEEGEPRSPDEPENTFNQHGNSLSQMPVAYGLFYNCQLHMQENIFLSAALGNIMTHFFRYPSLNPTFIW